MQFKRLIFVIYLGFIFSTCSIDSSINNQSIRVRMIGTYEAPADATGTNEPITQTYQVQQINLIGTDGTSIGLLTDNTITAQISNRALLVFEKELTSSYVGLTFSQLQVVVNTSFSGTSKYSKTLTATLASPEILYDTPFEIPKGQDMVFTIYVQWRATITRDTGNKSDTMSAPTFRVGMEKS